MAVRKVKPTSPGRRFQAYSTFEEITRSHPEKSLLRVIKKTGGRNVNGRITARHRGGDTSAIIASSISSVIKSGFQPVWRRSNTIPIGRRVLPC